MRCNLLHPADQIILMMNRIYDYGMTTTSHAVYRDTEGTAARFTKDTPIAIVDNNCVIVTGQNLLNAFDRLEVAEYSAKALLSAGCLGDIVHIGPEQIHDLEVAFKL